MKSIKFHGEVFVFTTNYHLNPYLYLHSSKYTNNEGSVMIQEHTLIVALRGKKANTQHNAKQKNQSYLNKITILLKSNF